METITGRFLIRKVKTVDGEQLLMVVGTAFPNFNINEVSDCDEVWAVRFGIEDIMKFEHTGDGWHGGAERFLAANPIMDGKGEWKRKV